MDFSASPVGFVELVRGRGLQTPASHEEPAHHTIAISTDLATASSAIRIAGDLPMYAFKVAFADSSSRIVKRKPLSHAHLRGLSAAICDRSLRGYSSVGLVLLAPWREVVLLPANEIRLNFRRS